MLARHAAFKSLDATFLTTRCDFSNSLRITSLAHPYSLTPIESHPYQKHQGSPGFSRKPPVFRTFFQVPYPLTPFFSHSSKNNRGGGYCYHYGTLRDRGLRARTFRFLHKLRVTGESTPGQKQGEEIHPEGNFNGRRGDAWRRL